MTAPRKNRDGGFSLIEVIVTLVIVAVLGAMLATYMGTSVVRSTTPVANVNQALSLQQVMENITADYRNTVFSKADLITLRTGIGAEGTTQSNSYGSYIVDKNHFIKFVANSEADDTGGTQNLLKVTVKNSLGEILTVLFSAQ